MKAGEIKVHWDSLSKQHAKDLKSTTKSATIKKLEINALAKCIDKLKAQNIAIGNILEIGCGNGHNIFGLSKLFPECKFTGVDYSGGMIENANLLKNEGDFTNTNFFTGDILKLEQNSDINKQFDIVFTDRCIINLNTIELQLEGLRNLSGKVKTGGYLMIIENIAKTYNNQNSCREAIGLDKRTPDSYNLFIDEDKFLEFADKNLNLTLLNTYDFASLHDLMLYVLLPKINSETSNYDHPLMDAVTELLINIEGGLENSFGSFGQNRLFLFEK